MNNSLISIGGIEQRIAMFCFEPNFTDKSLNFDLKRAFMHIQKITGLI